MLQKPLTPAISLCRTPGRSIVVAIKDGRSIRTMTISLTPRTIWDRLATGLSQLQLPARRDNLGPCPIVVCVVL